jgi:hypothetical protein
MLAVISQAADKLLEELTQDIETHKNPDGGGGGGEESSNLNPKTHVNCCRGKSVNETP